MRIGRSIALALAALLSACSAPVPNDKLAYVGIWQGPDMRLEIRQDGRVNYKRKQGSSSTSVSAPLQEFKGNGFSAGLGPISTTFVVTVPPHQDGGATKMTVDGVELTRLP